MKATQDAILGNVVTEFMYVLTGTNGKNTNACLRRIVLDAPVPNSFIPFNSLSEQNVLTWAINHLSQFEIDAMKNGITAKLNTIQNSEVEVLLPWQQS